MTRGHPVTDAEQEFNSTFKTKDTHLSVLPKRCSLIPRGRRKEMASRGQFQTCAVLLRCYIRIPISYMLIN